MVINNGIIHSVFGGDGYDSNATGNIVIINGGTYSSSICGGYSLKDSYSYSVGKNASNNIVTINDGTFFGRILGGYSRGWSANNYNYSGDADNNKITINGGTFNNDTSYGDEIGEIYGGWSWGNPSGSASNNVVIINGGTFNVPVYGGKGKYANNNTITIKNGIFYEGILGSSSDYGGTYENNTVNIYGGTFNAAIYVNSLDTGSSINIYESPNLSKARLSGNTINIYTKDLTTKDIYTQNLNFYLDSNIKNGDTILTLTQFNYVDSPATDISNTNITAVVQGGLTLTDGNIVTLIKNEDGVTEAKSYTGTLAEGVSLIYPMTVKRANDGNRIILGLGNFIEDDTPKEEESETTHEPEPEPSIEPTIFHDSNNVVNVYDDNSGTIYGGNTDTGNALNNIVNLYGGTNLEDIYGGYAPNGSTSGNILNVHNKNLTAQNIYNFDKLNFYVPSDAINGDTLLTLTDAAGTNLKNIEINAGVVADNANLVVGDRINLLTNSNGLTTNGVTYGTLTEGVSLNYGMNLSHAENSVVANITRSPNSLNPETEILPVSGTMPGVGTIDTSMNTPTIEDDKEFDTKEAAVATQIVEPKGWEIFANMGGGSLRTKGSDGSHVDMTTQSINLGFARSLESSAGKFTIAPIIDYANGNYDSYLETGVHGNGKTRYIAGGLIARRMLDNGFYYEGSVRVGKVKTDFSSDNIDKTGAFGRVTYDTSATTLAGHLKFGKAFRLNKNNLLDVYGIYYHAHQNGMSADLSSGEHYDFSSANSGRFRLGYRLTTRTSKISKIYTGLAYQYEHSSGVTATYKNYSTPGAGESGSSGMLELGWIIKPLKSSPFAVDINATGWIGHQRGITAMAKIQKSF